MRLPLDPRREARVQARAARVQRARRHRAQTTVTIRNDLDGEGVFETILTTVVTDASGNYSVTADPGNYRVVVAPGG